MITHIGGLDRVTDADELRSIGLPVFEMERPMEDKFKVPWNDDGTPADSYNVRTSTLLVILGINLALWGGLLTFVAWWLW
jgi:hypothetical protein